MTSDQGSSGGSLQLERTPVTPKAPGLNPNATVFHSHSPSGDQAWELDEATTPEGQVNGDLGGDVVNYPPTPESPADQEKEDCPLENGVTSDTADETASSTDDGKEETGLRVMLKHQLEYYFSDENLAVDSYLISQMDGDQYVPIVTIANFNQVKKLTSDLELIVEVLRESSHVQVDEKGEKVRPIHKRCIVILREIPASTPLKDVKDLFSGQNCPLFVSCEFAHGDCWYVTFNSDEDAQRAYQYLREEVKTFLGKPIMARIKAKPIIRGTFVPKNGIKSAGFESGTQAFPQQPSRFAQPQFTPLPPMPVQYVNTAGPQSFPFYPPNTVMAWSPTSPPFFDPGMVFAANGYQPQGFKLSNSTGRSGFQSPRNRAQVKQHGRTQSNPERMSEAKPNFETHRHSSVSSSLHGGNNPTSNVDPSQSSHMSSHRHSSLSSSTSSSYPVHATSHSSTASDNGQVLGPRHMEVTVKDQTTQPPRRSRINEFRNRRRKEDGARNLNSNPYTAKEYRLEPEEFELEATSFPPLPGSTNNASVGEVFENKLSDVVKGVAKPSIRDQKPSNGANTNGSVTTSTPAVANHPTTSAQSENKGSATMTNGTDSLPTPPSSPQKVSKSAVAANTVEKIHSQPEVNGVIETKEDNKENSSHPTQSQEPAKLSWAQMAQRAKERAEREATEVKKLLTVEAEQEIGDQVKPGTLKENAQTSKTPGTSKGLARSDSESKDFRPQTGRRAKDNREWKDRDRDKERDRRKEQETVKLSAK
ncbi:la-related protein 4 isoform X2 [Lingula anatina]|uniref:La-related protein 4 isoform X2 n=1 Tax=Lingula anatina TaxID=7574 RepID=A0A1S3H4Q9_LINAN|nr:la-related protein 4 isoform X2 [Lingula anatina]|eukprot:XP_013381115.1 la-related protein 4 isoform X2 [Lingula anatina]